MHYIYDIMGNGIFMVMGNSFCPNPAHDGNTGQPEPVSQTIRDRLRSLGATLPQRLHL